LKDLFTCNVLYLGMIIVDKFCDNDDATMIRMNWMGTQHCKTLLTFLFKLTLSCCFLKFLCVAQNPTYSSGEYSEAPFVSFGGGIDVAVADL